MGSVDANARTLVIGLGNPLLKDDSIGLRVVRALQPMIDGFPGVELAEDYHGGLRLMERMIGFRRAIVIDAIVTGGAAGTLHLLGVEGHATQRSASAHDVDLPTALAVGRQAGADLPDAEDILLVGIEAESVLDFGEKLTPAVEAAIPVAVRVVLEQLRKTRRPDDLT
jgi:hydrogenase maturation protease